MAFFQVLTEHLMILEYFQRTLMTVLVNYAMFSIDPERLVNINTVNYEVNNIFNACKNLTRYLGFKKYLKENIQKHSADAVKIVTDNKQHLGKLMRASLPSCGRMGLVCR